MEFYKPDKEVQRPRGNDVADQACSRSCGWRGELCEAPSVAAAVSAEEEHARESLHATHVPPEKCLKWQLQLRRFERCAASIHSRRARGARRSPPVISSMLRFGLAVPA
jgi:hypothetical protein